METIENLKELKDLYNKKLRYNFSITTIKTKIGDVGITFLGCEQFGIAWYYGGTVALGERKWDYDRKKAVYRVMIIRIDLSYSTLKKVIIKHERKLSTAKPEILFLKEEENL